MTPRPLAQYVAARRVLLDALDALEAHADAIIVAGAQAVYLRTGPDDLAVAPFTTDGDLAIDPAQLGDDPQLEVAMSRAGFRFAELAEGHIEPGIWVCDTTIDGVAMEVPVDLIVPRDAADPAGRRGARLGAHGRRAARKIFGLEAALVDHDEMNITSLDPADGRTAAAKVAGPAALLVAKAHKIRDRSPTAQEDRLSHKDAADCFRLMQTTVADQVGETLAHLTDHPVAGRATRAAIEELDALFGRRGRAGIAMAADALRFALPAIQVEAICVAYTRALLAAARRQ